MFNINDYNYCLPSDLLAMEPASPRDSSRLFIYNTKADEVKFDRFFNIDKYLPQNSLLVLNSTKVVPSRITLYKESEGKVVALLLVNEMKRGEKEIKAFVDRKVEIGQSLMIDKNHTFTVINQQEKVFTLRINFSQNELIPLLEKKGSMPIPLYLKKSPLKRHELKEKYQTVFAQNYGSSAAPTASLHLTRRLLKKLERKRIDKIFIKLHVGLGTFAPIDEKNLSTHKLHKEWIEIGKNSALAINEHKDKGGKIVAVGTTVIRSLETATIKNSVNYRIKEYYGNTDIFIYPPYEFKVVDILITNFHLPKSSLMMLVDAFLKNKGAKRNIVNLYKLAIESKFRFYSFGDAMLIM